MATKKSNSSGSTGGSANGKSAKKPATETQGGQTGDQPQLLELFLDQLRDIYWAEKHLVKALPKMQKAATSEELATAFEDHLAVTEEQVTKVEQVFELLGEKARGKKCEAMEGLVAEAEAIIKDTEEGSATRDVALIIAAQKVEHYEIASYGGLATLAKTLGNQEVGNILGEILEEEKEADVLLTELAESNINMEAAREDEGSDEER